ncbi:hypothetical protein HUK80_01990 [Flavobacterium sp. MAH-1]|uniref:Uncharacterized protein n=1 Tax=Flavobacterium agri TaxID=2743471 RepID=A0A7Y9C407_9FLAO|nr:hypothetical protein [Flavobacterium agri]NUY79651.1 hypothetical protein [Flavobacterium agri]NYA69676.1 hypothetical protein [Flavobacterium agri]
MKNANVKFGKHYKLEVLFKDKIIFESELYNHGIDFYFEEDQPNISQGIKYFLKDSDRAEVDSIIVQNEIVASTETIQLSDYRDEAKVQKLYLKVTVVITILIGVVSLIISLMK